MNLPIHNFFYNKIIGDLKMVTGTLVQPGDKERREMEANDTKQIHLTPEEMRDARESGRLKCRCNKDMVFLPGDNIHSEFYCASCHLSAPLY